eukprot:510034-Rhodomonas_salina.1
MVEERIENGPSWQNITRKPEETTNQRSDKHASSQVTPSSTRSSRPSSLLSSTRSAPLWNPNPTHQLFKSKTHSPTL